MDPINLREVGEVVGVVPRLSNEAVTWLQAHDVPLNLEPGMYCLEQPSNELWRWRDTNNAAKEPEETRE